MSVLSKLKLSARSIVVTMTPTPTSTPTPTPTLTPTPTPTPTILFSITSQTSNNSTVNEGDSVVDVQIYSSGGSYTIVWEVWNGGSRYVTLSTTSGTISSGYNNFYGPNAIPDQFYSYGSGAGQYYNENGGAGYYKATITVGGASVNTGYIKINTRDTYECDCWCKNYSGGPQVGNYECYGGETCTDNCCEIDCSGDCNSAYGCRNECDQSDFDYCNENYCPCSPTACGQTCSCNTYYYCNGGGTYSCETCEGTVYYAQY